MDITRIRHAIEDALTAAGMKPVNDDYDDSSALTAVYPETKWAVGPGGCGQTCLVVIHADRVQKWQRNTPYNHTTGFPVGAAIAYETPEQMVEAVRKLAITPKAACWK